jgi:hypothetical protein
LSLFLGACATPKFEPINLTPENISQSKRQVDAEVKSIAVMLAPQSQQTGEVRVQQDFLNTWKESLQVSLDRAAIFKDDAKRKVTVEGLVRKFDFNPTGFSNEVFIEVTYRVTDRSTKAVVFEYDTQTTAKMDSSEVWVAIERLKRIWNRATQESIRQFVIALDGANI